MFDAAVVPKHVFSAYQKWVEAHGGTKKSTAIYQYTDTSGLKVGDVYSFNVKPSVAKAYKDFTDKTHAKTGNQKHHHGGSKVIPDSVYRSNLTPHQLDEHMQ